LQHHNKKSVLFLPWLGPSDEHGTRKIDMAKAEEAIGYILDSPSLQIKGLKKKEKFRREDTGHLQLLIADFIALGTIVRHNEIRSFLKGLGFLISPKVLNQYLFLLEKLNIVNSTQYGTTRYYLAGLSGSEYISYALKSAEAVDRQRLKSDLLEVLPKDVYRPQAYEAFQERVPGNG
jgi:hypothetical protein